MIYEFSGLGETRAILDILQSCFIYLKGIVFLVLQLDPYGNNFGAIQSDIIFT